MVDMRSYLVPFMGFATSMLLLTGIVLLNGSDSSKSVELGLSEVSPSGEAGGFAVPASGSSRVISDGVTVSHQCVNNQVRTSITYTFYTEETKQRSQLYLNNNYEGVIYYNSPKTVTLPSNTSYNGEITWAYFYDIPNARYSNTGMGQGRAPFSFTTPDCAPRPPTVTLEVANTTTGSGWTGSSITIEPTEQIALQWRSTNANSCSANFTGSNATNEVISNPDEPAPGTSKDYVVVCSGSDGQATDSLRVTTNPYDLVDLIGNPGFVQRGDTADLTWSIGNNPPDQCNLSGPGLSGVLSSFSQPITVTVTGESEYTLTCPGGTDTTIIRILPEVQET